MLNNKQISFAGPENTNNGDQPRAVYQEIYVFTCCWLHSIISPLQFGKAEFGIGSSGNILVHFFVAFPTTTTINYLDIFTPK